MAKSVDKIGVGIIGAGRMGQIRALSASQDERTTLVALTDASGETARAVGARFSCDVCENWEQLLDRSDIHAVVIATPHKYLTPIAVAALRAGKHVFCEKPAARTKTEAEQLMNAQTESELVIGFTLRHHPAIVAARKLVAGGGIGNLMYVRGRYGHGGRPGYGTEWRADRDLAGGGELLDQGVHLIDLSRWFLGDFSEVSAAVDNCFWRSTVAGARSSELPPPVEDNAFLLLRSSNVTAALHASWTQWKNLFSFEVFGSDGSLEVNGLGGFYGTERLIVTRRRPQGGVPDVQEFVYDAETGDARELGNAAATTTQNAADVWRTEWSSFVSVMANGRNNKEGYFAEASGSDAYATLSIVEAAYRSSEHCHFVSVGDETRRGRAVEIMTSKERNFGQ